ncbi:MAG TPA: wax ester/triacylglycerol synthase family O-acyltransferase [Casimicrobiaceae bacterium]|jgi:WS/DGAT/MGAT family acyltransferase
MAANERERISAVDTAWLRMDRPSNLMMICGVLLFRERLALARLKKVISERFLVFRRFRQRPVESTAAAFWETDPAFDLDHHVVPMSLTGRAGTRELQSLVSQLVSTPLDPARPMWQFHLVDNFDGGSALIARIHHCYADGIALVRVMLSMTDSEANGAPAMPFEPRERKRTPQTDSSDDMFSQLITPFRGGLDSARKIGGTLIEKGVEIWNDPAKAVDLAGRASALTAEIANLALMAQDSATRFKGTPGIAKRVAWADPLSLPEVKTIGKALGASVNDVLLASVAGALRSYLLEKGDRADGVMLRALVPVNLRPIEKAYRLGNQFGLVFLDLPIGIENPVERLYKVRANMRALKDSYQPILALGLLAAMGAGPKILQEKLLAILARNATAVMTNVPGPQKPLYLAGGRIESLMFWVPQSGNIGIGVSIISYNDSVQFGVVTDRGLCPDPEKLMARFGTEFEKLVLTTLMSPWPRDGELDPDIAAQAIAS